MHFNFFLVYIESVDDDKQDEQDPDPSIMERHFKALQKEMNKTCSNLDVVSVYLDKQYSARRSWLLLIPAEDRCQKLLAKYPCFKDHLEVIFSKLNKLL